MVKKKMYVFAMLLTAISIGTFFMPNIWKTTSNNFEIIENTSTVEDSYISVVYMDGYAYSPSEWLKYSRLTTDSETIRGDKIGEVTLDLKGIQYTGTPPDFSSTHNVGTEIYAIQGMKKGSAILVIDSDYTSIFYRAGKILLDDQVPINLTLKDVFSMLTDALDVSSVELRSEEDGSWMYTSQDALLLSIINDELPGLSLLNYSELDQNPYTNGHRVPINLMFKDGAALHMQVYPQEKIASVFGGFVRLSPEFCEEIQKLSKQDTVHPSLTNMLAFKEDVVTYLHLINHTNGDEVLCETPEWSRMALYNIFGYYRMEAVADNPDHDLVMTSTIGKSEEDNEVLEFYETADEQIIVKLSGHTYKPIMGKITFEELKIYLYNSTGLEF